MATGSSSANRYLITGAAGYLGQNLPFGIKLPRAKLDVTSKESIVAALDQVQPTGIVNLACLDVRRSESQPLAAYDVNVKGAYLLAYEAARRDLPLVQLSTACVFAGPVGAVFGEDSIADPINTYGLTKHLSELVVAQLAPRHLIVRTGWLFGAVDSPRFLDVMPMSLRQGGTARVNRGQTGSPTYLPDFSTALEKVIEEGRTGLIHLVNSDTATALDVANEIQAIQGAAGVVTPVEHDSLNDMPRSSSEALKSNILPLRPWRPALADFVAKTVNGDK